MGDTKMNLGLLRRSVTLGRVTDERKRRITASFMSEEPYQRSWGVEVLSMAGADLSRAVAGTMPVLVGHDDDDQVGVVERAWIEGSRGKAVLKFGNGPRATEIWDDITNTGIRRGISVGYVVNKMENTGINERGVESFLVTDFEVLEISSVPVPADPSVGVGRNYNYNDHQTVVRNNIMELKDKAVRDMTSEEYATTRDQWTPAQKEENRVSEILAIGKSHGFTDDAIKAVQDGTSLKKFSAWVLNELEQRSVTDSVIVRSPARNTTGNLNRPFSLQRLIASQIPGSKVDAGYEYEACQETARRFKGNYQGLAVPLGEVQQRDITTDVGDQGGYLVQTDLMASSFAELLRNKVMCAKMGATVMTGLSGDVDIPTQATGSTVYHVAETGSLTESTPTFGQIRLTPARAGAYLEVSRQALLQSGIDLEQMLRNDLASALAVDVDAKAINGIGASNEPTGILKTTGIGSVAGGTDGLAPALSHIIELETDVAAANADFGSLGYLTNSDVRSVLKQTLITPTYGDLMVWQPGDEEFGRLNGYKAGVSNNVPSNLEKGSSGAVCSAIIFGNWSELIIAYWGGLDIVVDHVSLATTGLVRIVANLYYDCAVRRPASFSAMQDALTS
nr:hypothetical protein 14 [Desulfobulbaceae bacterium]